MMVNLFKYICFIIFIVAITGCEDERNEWKNCPQSIHPDPEVGSLLSSVIGKVKMTDGDECLLEEVSEVYANCRSNPYARNVYYFDGALQCKYCKDFSTPKARRLICKSGAKSTNTIYYDGTKFHREIIQ